MKLFTMNKREMLTCLLGCYLSLHAVALGEGKGSVWKDAGGGASMYTDRKAMAIGDIVTIVIQESASVSASKSSETEKSTTVSDQINQLLYPTSDFLRKDGNLPGLDWSSSNTFSGSGTISDQQSVESRISAVVVDRLPNGNLVIEGVRKVTIGDERNYIILRGYIRPVDIEADNTIVSSRVASAELEMIAEGPLTEAQRKGWLSRFYSWLNPF